MISPCLSDVIVNTQEGSGARIEPIPAALEKTSSLPYNTKILSLPRLCATDYQNLICSALLLTCFPFSFFTTCILSCSLWLHICSQVMYFYLHPFSSAFFSFFLLFPELFFHPSLIFHFLLWSGLWEWESEDEIPSQVRCRNPWISQSVKKKLQWCKISSVFSIKAPKAILRVRRKEGSHDNWRLNSIWCLLLMSLLRILEWKLMMPGWCICSTMT